jgi:beta-mannosidase
MLAHQKNNEGNSIIHDYLLRDYPEPKDFPSFLYVSQVLQAEGIKIGAEHFRRSRPETMGSIFWQLNDCWPVASWSSIDYYGRWKALQYYARRFYAPILVSPHVEGGSVKVYIVSDLTFKQGGRLVVRLMDFDGRVLLKEDRIVNVEPLSSAVYLEWPLKKLTDAGAADTSRVFVSAELGGADTTISSNIAYLAPTKEIHLKPAVLDAAVSSGGGGAILLKDAKGKNAYTIRVTSPVLARDVYLSFGDLDVKLSDNYFDILPGESVEITGITSASLDALKAKLKVVSLTDAFGGATQGATVGAAQ